MKLTEDDLEFDFDGALTVLKFDDGTHSASSVQPVDFIVEYTDHFLFIEVKDPDVPNPANLEAFRKKLSSGELIKNLARKYRDSRFFLSFQQNQTKEFKYVVLLSMQSLDDALLLSKQDELHRSIPLSHPSWQTNSATACAILNLAQWQKRYGVHSVCRLSEMS
jgi:hypothetical protein